MIAQRFDVVDVLARTRPAVLGVNPEWVGAVRLLAQHRCANANPSAAPVEAALALAELAKVERAPLGLLPLVQSRLSIGHDVKKRACMLNRRARNPLERR